MFIFSRAPRSATIFRTASQSGMWRVSRDGHFQASYWSEGDARRAACLRARQTESEGGVARVLTQPDDVRLRHNEPQFGR
jgi:hypothetical protein